MLDGACVGRRRGDERGSSGGGGGRTFCRGLVVLSALVLLSAFSVSVWALAASGLGLGVVLPVLGICGRHLLRVLAGKEGVAGGTASAGRGQAGGGRRGRRRRTCSAARQTTRPASSECDQVILGAILRLDPVSQGHRLRLLRPPRRVQQARERPGPGQGRHLCRCRRPPAARHHRRIKRRIWSGSVSG